MDEYVSYSVITSSAVTGKENNFKTIDLDKAQKGDVFYYKDKTDLDGTLGICIGESVMFNWKKEIAILPKKECKIAWRIE